MCKEVHVYLAAVSTSDLVACRTTKYLYVRTTIISYERPDINVSAARSAMKLSRSVFSPRSKREARSGHSRGYAHETSDHDSISAEAYKSGECLYEGLSSPAKPLIKPRSQHIRHSQNSAQTTIDPASIFSSDLNIWSCAQELFLVRALT